METVQEEQVAVWETPVGWKKPGIWVDDLKNGGLLGCPRELVNG